MGKTRQKRTRTVDILKNDELLISLINGEIDITPKVRVLQNALAIARKHLVDSPNLNNALIAERRKEA